MLNELMHMQHHNDTRAVHSSLLNVRAMFSEQHTNIAQDAADAEVISDDVARTAIQLAQISEIIERPIVVAPANEASDEDLLREFFGDNNDTMQEQDLSASPWINRNSKRPTEMHPA